MSGINVYRVPLGSYECNCYLVHNTADNNTIIIDCGDGKELVNYIEKNNFNLNIKYGLLTHGHFDHIWGTNRLQELSGAPLYAYEAEKVLCEDAVTNVSDQVGRPYTVLPDSYLKDGEEITIADMTCRLIATPGHTVGSCCYYFEEDGILIAGDTLFQDSVGRTDLATGSMSALVRSIKEKLFKLPEETKVYPGHGESTTIGHERKYNPFVS